MRYFEVEPTFLRDSGNIKLKNIAVFSKNLSSKDLEKSVEIYKKVVNKDPAGINVFLGIGWDGSTAGRPGARFSPQKILEKFISFNLNYFYKKSILIAPYVKVVIGNKEKTFLNISKTVKKVLEYERIFNDKEIFKFFIGGDHSITFSIIAQYLEHYEKINLVVFDTHFDLRIIKEGLSGGTYLQELKTKYNERINVMILGIKDLANPLYLYKEAQKHRVKYLSNLDILEGFEKIKDFLNHNLSKDRPVYISIDIDSIDIAYIDSVNSPYSLGFKIEDIYKIVDYLNRNYRVVGIDFVEFNPLVGNSEKSLFYVSELLYYISRN